MPSGDGRRFTGGEARGTRQEENERTHARTHAARTERGGAEVNASRSPKFLGQPVVRATRSTELVDPRRWVVVAPVTSIPAEALQSKRPMPKTHTTRELSLSPTSSSRYPNARQFQRDSFSIFFVPRTEFPQKTDSGDEDLSFSKIRQPDSPKTGNSCPRRKKEKSAGRGKLSDIAKIGEKIREITQSTRKSPCKIVD